MKKAQKELKMEKMEKTKKKLKEEVESRKSIICCSLLISSCLQATNPSRQLMRPTSEWGVGQPAWASQSSGTWCTPSHHGGRKAGSRR